MVQVHGTVDINQFYYFEGLSDADTVKIDLTVDSVRFRPDSKSKWLENLEVFNEASVGSKPVVHNQKVTIRLQGIDAPELHYQAKRGIPQAKMTANQKRDWKNSQFRQWWGARATWELATFLKSFVEGAGSLVVKAFVFSRVDSPSDLFDVYGRLVGDIIIDRKPLGDIVISKDLKNELNINQWLAQEGWAFPTFYDSMTVGEITTLSNLGKKAKSNADGIWSSYADTLVEFDPSLVLPPRKQLIKVSDDSGDLNMPKIFRRQVQYEVNHRAGIFSENTLTDYLSDAKKQDMCYKTSEFLSKDTAVKKYKLSDLLEKNGKINFEPADLVFIEKESNLHDHNGNKIDSWY